MGGPAAGKLNHPALTRQARAGEQTVRVKHRSIRGGNRRDDKMSVGYVNCRGLKGETRGFGFRWWVLRGDEGLI